MITTALIERFLRNECTQAERRAVLAYFRQHPEEWAHYLEEEGWEQFEQLADYDEEYAGKLFTAVAARTLDRRVIRRRVMRWMSAAAGGGLFAGGWWWLSKGGRHGSRMIEEAPALAAVTDGGWQHTSNMGKAVRVITLPDGSAVELAPGSVIDYSTAFLQSDKRTVYLTGKASFRVAKDGLRPFTVNSGAIGTTVLGTYFTVDAFPQASEMRVSLHEGRVVVRACDTAVRKWAKGEYLFPGDVLVYEKRTGLAIVKRAVKEDVLVKAVPMADDGSYVHRPDWYQFDGQALPEVLDQLSTYYKVTIYYYPAQLSNRYFKGRIEKTDSLDNILRDIALLHHLTIRRDSNSNYRITSKSH